MDPLEDLDGAVTRIPEATGSVCTVSRTVNKNGFRSRVTWTFSGITGRHDGTRIRQPIVKNCGLIVCRSCTAFRRTSR